MRHTLVMLALATTAATASTTTPACDAELQASCGTDAAKHNSPFASKSCAVCAGQRQHELRSAGCSHEDITSYCQGEGGGADSLLADQFCQVYYDGADAAACPALRDRVVANHTRALPTLELVSSLGAEQQLVSPQQPVSPQHTKPSAVACDL